MRSNRTELGPTRLNLSFCDRLVRETKNTELQQPSKIPAKSQYEFINTTDI